ncbi:copper chaperone PCu(A)C [Sphingomonas oligophenolica]|uniref:Copper chaperone PCu(A)C n=1 Tax=Sphingomonas oligophenolica TaxID=301154 RepID=A0ABU9XYS5_9SPHN
MRFLALLITMLALAGCQPKEIYVSDGYVRLAAVKGHPAAAYFTLHGGETDATLISVSSDVAIRTELHESMQAGSMSSMKPLDHLAVPAGSKIVFKPGGKHVMLFDVNPIIVPGRTLPLLFTFADGLRIEYAATVIAAGDPAP